MWKNTLNWGYNKANLFVDFFGHHRSISKLKLPKILVNRSNMHAWFFFVLFWHINKQKQVNWSCNPFITIFTKCCLEVFWSISTGSFWKFLLAIMYRFNEMLSYISSVFTFGVQILLILPFKLSRLINLSTSCISTVPLHPCVCLCSFGSNAVSHLTLKNAVFGKILFSDFYNLDMRDYEYAKIKLFLKESRVHVIYLCYYYTII